MLKSYHVKALLETCRPYTEKGYQKYQNSYHKQQISECLKTEALHMLQII